jgi:hypothetical protein
VYRKHHLKEARHLRRAQGLGRASKHAPVKPTAIRVSMLCLNSRTRTVTALLASRSFALGDDPEAGYGPMRL